MPIGEDSPGDTQAKAMMPAFLTESQKRRLCRIRAGNALFAGQWRKFLLDDGRTAHVFKSLQSASGRERPLLITVNVLGLAAKKCADLLMLNPPTFAPESENAAQADAIKRIGQASHIGAVLYEGALTASFEADAWLQVMRIDNRVCIVNRPADQCFPIGEQRADGTYPAVERMWVETAPVVAGQTTQRKILRKEIHAPGLISNQAFALDDRGAIDRSLPLLGAPAQYETGVDEPLLDFVPNFTVGGESISDFDGVEEIVDAFTASVSQAAGVIAKHADPKLGLPEDLFDDNGKFKISQEAFAFRNKDEIPVYLVWQAQLEAALKMMDNWLKWLLVTNEMSPSLLGLREGAAPDAWKKLRLEAMNTLAKVARKKIYWTPFLTDIWRKAFKLEQVSGWRYAFSDVSTDWHDGIPLDEAELAEQVGKKRQDGLVDRRTAVEEIYGVGPRADQVNERLDEEQRATADATRSMVEREVFPAAMPAIVPAAGGESGADVTGQAATE